MNKMLNEISLSTNEIFKILYVIKIDRYNNNIK